MSDTFYGIWIPKSGWLKNGDDALAFDDKAVADSVAERIGRGASVEYIDSALKEIEGVFLEAEYSKSENIWWRVLARKVRNAVFTKSN